MPMVYILVGLGPNSIAMIARISSSSGNLVSFMKEVFPEVEPVTTDEITRFNLFDHEYHPGHRKIWKYYNNGCGGVYRYEIRPALLDSVLTTFDLD